MSLQTISIFCQTNQIIAKHHFSVSILDYLDGWLCFIVSILLIGLLTAFIGDLASHFGCTVGLSDTVTAISFVALGTSIPGMYRSELT